jgi:uncharacterized protein (DUF362 family)
MNAARPADIAISKAADIDDPAEARRTVFAALDLLDERIVVPPAARVLIKVNLCLLLGHETGATVDPSLVRYLIEWLFERRAIGEAIIAEADATHLSADVAFRVLGWQRLFADLPRTRFLNLSADELVTVKLDGFYFREVEMARTFMEADYLISFAKLKTHTLQTITGVMKNQWGALPEKVKWVYHPVLDRVICDLTRLRPPDLCVVDGLIAHEGAGPVDGTPRVMGLVIAGTDAVATDRVCARLMCKDPRRVPHLRLAAKHGLGARAFRVLGCRIEDVRQEFAFVPRWRLGWERLRDRLARLGRGA